MDTLKESQEMMAEQTGLALTTVGTDDVPNVRIVNCYFNPENNVVYFVTFKNNDKVEEVKQDRNVTFTTIPKKENEHIKTEGTTIKSKKNISDLADCFCKKIPDYRGTIGYGGKSLTVFEIHFETVTVTLGLSNSKILKL